MNAQSMTPAALNVSLNAKNDPIIRKCKYCGAAFEPKSKANDLTAFCCDEHRYAYRNSNRKALRLEQRIKRHRERTRSLALNGFGQMSGPVNKQSSPVVFR
jgi:hypothetical protein